MSGQNKLQTDRNQKQLLELVSLPGNNICADCKARNPRWASHNLGIFICVNCASIHRKIGTHITKVKSVTMDNWTREQVEAMRAKGNVKSNAIFNPNELRYPPPPNLEDSERDSEIEQYIRSKYQYRRFLDKSALVASKLGPSKSAERTVPSERSKSQAQTPMDQPLTATAAAANVVIPPRRPIVSPAHAALAKANTPACPLGLDKKPTPGPSTIWNDLSSLGTPGQDSSLPLQYQVPSAMAPAQLQSSTFNRPTPAMSYPTIGVTSTGINPFQARMGLAPSQQPTLSSFTPSLSTAPSVSMLFNNAQSQQPFGQPWGTASTQPAPVMIQSTTQTSFFQPQPQLSVQLQPTPSGILSHSPNQQLFSGPFLTPSPSHQLLSHSPQPQMQPLQTRIVTPAGFQTPMSAQVNMGFGGTGMTPGQPSFLGTTTMQMMQQQQMLQQQQAMFGASQMQPMPASRMGPGGNMFGGGQMYPQGSQWGAM